MFNYAGITYDKEAIFIFRITEDKLSDLQFLLTKKRVGTETELTITYSYRGDTWSLETLQQDLPQKLWAEAEQFDTDVKEFAKLDNQQFKDCLDMYTKELTGKVAADNDNSDDSDESNQPRSFGF